MCVKTSVLGFVRQSCLKIDCMTKVCFDNSRNVQNEPNCANFCLFEHYFFNNFIQNY